MKLKVSRGPAHPGEKSIEFEADIPGRESQPIHGLAGRPSLSFLAILSRGFIISKMQMQIRPPWRTVAKIKPVDS